MEIAAHLSHFFLPRQSNNQRARILHPLPLAILVLFLVGFQVFLQNINRLGFVLGYASNIPPEKIVELTNQKRQERGIPSLQLDPILSQAALTKAADMFARDYWAHIAPDGTEPWKFFKDAGYNYRFAGENLARDFADPSSVVAAWLASPTHKENLLSTRYKDIGVAVVDGELDGVETTLIVEFFGTRLGAPGVLPPVPVAGTQVPTPVPERELLVSPFNISKNTGLLVALVFLSVLTLDVILVWRRKIVRISGRTLAHLAFLAAIALGVLAIKSGIVI